MIGNCAAAARGSSLNWSATEASSEVGCSEAVHKTAKMLVSKGKMRAQRTVRSSPSRSSLKMSRVGAGWVQKEMRRPISHIGHRQTRYKWMIDANEQ
jgi:hypothetical protein